MQQFEFAKRLGAKRLGAKRLGAKRLGSLLVLIAMIVQLGCNASEELGSDFDYDSAANEPVAVAEPPSAEPSGYEFEYAVRIKAGDEYVSVESPGYACPTMADVDNDGKLDLVVGQFNGGKMKFCKNIAEKGATPKFAKSTWIMTGSEPAQVPGVS